MSFLKSALLVVITAVFVALLPRLLISRVPADKVFGSCTKEFAGVEAVYRSNFASGLERGSALSVYYNGAAVCDMWGGYADESILRPWTQDSMGLWFSATKGIAAITVLTLVDRGLLDVHKPVAHYWPEFAQQGKAEITVEQLLSHSGGLAWIDLPMTYDDILNDPAHIRKAFEHQAPNWPPGTSHTYHALTIGLLMDQIVRRVDPEHRSIQQYFQQVIAKPHGIDYFIGTPLSEQHRIVHVNQIPPVELWTTCLKNRAMFKVFYSIFSDPDVKKMFNNPSTGVPDVDPNLMFNWPEARVVPQPSTNGHGTARAVAKLYGIIANGGKPIFNHSTTLTLFNKPVRSGIDGFIQANVTYGYGFNHIYNKEDESKHRVGTYGHGGQMGFADVQHKFSYGYVTNYLKLVLGEDDERTESIRAAIYEAVEQLK